MPPDPTSKIRFDWRALWPKLTQYLIQLAGGSGQDLLVQLDVGPQTDPFAVVAESTKKYAEDRAAELIGMKYVNGELIENPNPVYAITESTRGMLRTMINTALTEGWSAAKVRDEVIQNYGFSPVRALTIARTERALAQNKGALAAAKASGVVEKKRILLASEHPQEDDCDECEDEGWIAVDDDFLGEYDAPPFHPNCACTIEFGTDPLDEDDDEEKALRRNARLLKRLREQIAPLTNGNGNGHVGKQIPGIHDKDGPEWHEHFASSCESCGKIWRNCPCPFDGRELKRDGYCRACGGDPETGERAEDKVAFAQALFEDAIRNWPVEKDFDESRHPRDAHGKFSLQGLHDQVKDHAARQEMDVERIPEQRFANYSGKLRNLIDTVKARVAEVCDKGETFHHDITDEDRDVHRFIDAAGRELKTANGRWDAGDKKGAMLSAESALMRAHAVLNHLVEEHGVRKELIAVALDKDFDESQHPRDEQGRFGSGGAAREPSPKVRFGAFMTHAGFEEDVTNYAYHLTTPAGDLMVSYFGADKGGEPSARLMMGTFMVASGISPATVSDLVQRGVFATAPEAPERWRQVMANGVDEVDKGNRDAADVANNLKGLAGLKSGEMEGITSYVDGRYESMNDCARGAGECDEEIKTAINQMQGAIAHGPNYDGVVYRGMSQEEFDSFGDGKVTTNFLSASKSSFIAEGFAEQGSRPGESLRSYVVAIHTEGHGLDLSLLNNSEQEIVLPIGARLEYLEERGGIPHYLVSRIEASGAVARMALPLALVKATDDAERKPVAMLTRWGQSAIGLADLADPGLDPQHRQRWAELAALYNEASSVRKAFDESQHPRDQRGRFGEGGGVTLKPVKGRALGPKPIAHVIQLTKPETGALGEKIAIAYLKAQGFQDAAPLNLEHSNFPVDMLHDHELVEVKTGVTSSQSPRFKVTLGEASKQEKAWRKTATDDEKKDWDLKKTADAMERKQKALRDFAQQTGQSVRGKTIGIVLNPDTRVADVHVFSGFHEAIGWRGALAKESYVGSYRYSQ